MSWSGLIAPLLKSKFLAGLGKVVGGGLLSVAILGWVVEHLEPSTGEAVVHVMEADVEVAIGGNTYVVRERRYDPIVCMLHHGRHELVMSRRGRVLYREWFEIRGGQSVVLTAWDPSSH
jgi:hypothetical protein